VLESAVPMHFVELSIIDPYALVRQTLLAILLLVATSKQVATINLAVPDFGLDIFKIS